MKINDIYESITGSGSIAAVIKPMTTQSRNGVGKGVYGNEKPGTLLTGKKTNKKYANSIHESKMKEIASDLETMQDGNFKQKYGKTKQKMMSLLGAPTNLSPKSKHEVNEAHLEEDDLIIVPGQGHRLKSGFIPHGESRLDHEVEMARSDLFSAAKNAKQVYELIADVSEEEGLEGWVQEKIIKANDYLNTIREYLEGKQLQSEMNGGVIAGGGVGEGAMTTKPVSGEKPWSPPRTAPKKKYPAIGTVAWESLPRSTKIELLKKRGRDPNEYFGTTGLEEAQSMGTALKNSLAKAEPGSKLDNSIKSHNRHIKAGLPGTLKNAPTGYHFDKQGYCRLGDK